MAGRSKPDGRSAPVAGKMGIGVSAGGTAVGFGFDGLGVFAGVGGTGVGGTGVGGTDVGGTGVGGTGVDADDVGVMP